MNGRRDPRPRLVMVANKPPLPAISGHRIRLGALARELSRRFEVHLVVVTRSAPDFQEIRELTGVESVEWFEPRRRGGVHLLLGVAGWLLHRSSSLAAALREPLPLAHRIEELRARAVWCLGSNSAEMLPLEELRGLGVVVLVDLAHVEATAIGRELRLLRLGGWRRWRRRLRLLADRPARVAVERRVMRDADACFVSSADDALALAGPHEKRVVVVPNGTDVPVEPLPLADGGRIVLCGNFGYHPNEAASRWFAQHVFRRVMAECSNAELLLVGRQGDRLLDIASERIRILGFVPDVDSVYRTAAVVVAPLRSGSGTKLKVIEAMARGLPVVASSIGAEGLGVATGRELLVADEPEPFAQAVVNLISDRRLAARLGAAAHRFTRERFDWQVIGADLGDEIEALLKTLDATTARGSGCERR